MKKTAIYYTVLMSIVAIQFIWTVVNKSVAVQQSSQLVEYQKELSQLEKEQSDLVTQLATKTSLALITPETSGYIPISKPIVVQSPTLVAATH